jgi:hypothetical protein
VPAAPPPKEFVMNSFRKRYLSLAMVAGLAVFGVACDDADNGVDDPAVEEPADEGLEDDGLEDDGLEDDGLEGDDEMDDMDDDEDL